MSDPHGIQTSRLRWGLLLVSALVFVAACAGAAYETLEARRDAQRFPQRGKSIDIGGFRLNLNCTGSARPTVILESGLGVSSLGWINVQPEIGKYARVCSYDRAGYGWSERGKEPRTALQIVKELKALLEAANEEGPYILVGPSFGGFIVRVFTGQYPADVAGMILVEASHEDQRERVDRAYCSNRRQDERRGRSLDLTRNPSATTGPVDQWIAGSIGDSVNPRRANCFEGQWPSGSIRTPRRRDIRGARSLAGSVRP